MSPLSAMFPCRFETRLQYVRLVFDLKLILKSIDIDGKVGGPGLSVFGVVERCSQWAAYRWTMTERELKKGGSL